MQFGSFVWQTSVIKIYIGAYEMTVGSKFASFHRPLSRRLDRCDRMIQNESSDSNGVNACLFSAWRVRYKSQCKLRSLRTRKRPPVRYVICIVTYNSSLKTNTHYCRLGLTLDCNCVFAIKAYWTCMCQYGPYTVDRRNRALHIGHWMSPSWAILLEAIHAMFNQTDVMSHIWQC